MAKPPHSSASHRWSGGLLRSHEPDAVQVEGIDASPFVLICDHGGNRIPESLETLHVSDEDRARHIGWDIGALGVARAMAQHLGALLIHQPYSRLVIDCNRPPHVAQAFPKHADGIDIPGNIAITPHNAAARVAEIFQPYHTTIAATLDARAGRETILLSIHSYTPHYSEHPGPRPWPVSLLFNRDRRLSDPFAAHLRAQGVDVGMNQPYVVDDMGDYAIPVHAESRGLAHALIEVRQDLITDGTGQNHWAEKLAHGAEAARGALCEQKGLTSGAG